MVPSFPKLLLVPSPCGLRSWEQPVATAARSTCQVAFCGFPLLLPPAQAPTAAPWWEAWPGSTDESTYSGGLAKPS